MATITCILGVIAGVGLVWGSIFTDDRRRQVMMLVVGLILGIVSLIALTAITPTEADLIREDIARLCEKG